MSAVADLLSASRAAHAQYRRSAGNADRKGNVTQAYDESKCVPAIETALRTRIEAHAIDPEHLDPAWSQDTAEHEQLCRFYEKFLRT